MVCWALSINVFKASKNGAPLRITRTIFFRLNPAASFLNGSLLKNLESMPGSNKGAI
jgi:hypothetical protein